MRNNVKRQIRRNHIGGNALVIGTDIGKDFNALVFMNKQGEVLYRMKRLNNDYKGYGDFLQAVNQLCAKNGFDQRIMGMEPTGHYWRKLGYFAGNSGIEVRFVKTTFLKHQKALDQSNPAKADIKDAYDIANMMREGRYCDTVVKEDVYQQLRRLGKHRGCLLKQSSSVQNRLRAWLDDHFPELMSNFSDVKAKGLRALLRVAPTPEDVLRIGEEALAGILAIASRRRNQARQKARILCEAARVSIGLPAAAGPDRLRLALLLDELDQCLKQIRSLEVEMLSLLEQIEESRYLLSIHGIGLISAAMFFGELGDVQGFSCARDIVSFAGIDPYETESGKFYGRRRISKQGRYLLRATLYRMALSVICHNKQIKSYYARKLASNARLKRKEALCAVMIKLVKVIFALIRDKRMYVEEADLRRREVA
jgi:transposase